MFTVRAYGVIDCCCIEMHLKALKCRDPSRYSVVLSMLSLNVIKPRRPTEKAKKE